MNKAQKKDNFSFEAQPGIIKDQQINNSGVRPSTWWRCCGMIDHVIPLEE